MKIHRLNINPEQVPVDLKEIGSLLGNEMGGLDSKDLTENLLSRCREILTPQAAFVWVEALEENSGDYISIEGWKFNTGRIIKKMLKGSESYAFLIATAGPGPESLARELLEKGDYLEGYITDLLASALVESITNQAQEHLRRMAADKGLLISNRYSPGYCSWDVSEQQKLFGLFPENFCGITLTDSSLMSPIKSVSAVLGIGPAMKYQEYTCEICSMKDCSYRKTRANSSRGSS